MQVRFTAVVFDLDGTLIDSAADIAGALNTVLEAEGRRRLPVERVMQMIGDGSAMLVTRGFAATGPALDPAAHTAVLARFLEVYEAWPAGPETLYPGVVDTLDRLRADGLKIGLCTNKPEAVTRALLGQLALLDRFDALAGGDTLPHRKPDGRHLGWVLDRLGVTAAQAVMVGDNANDVAAARACGCPVVAVSYGYPRMPVAALGADVVIDRMAELPQALVRLTTGG